MQTVYVDSQSLLTTVLPALGSETTYLAIDTEFRRENTYFPELGLIQIATIDTIFIIDAIAISNLSPLFDLLTSPNILKVFHSARQDLEIFCHLMHGQVVRSIFDTQIAAMFLGYGESAGFETLVSKQLGVTLDKTSRHTDWTARPLTDKQRSYAINDVLHLRTLYDVLSQKLVEKGRFNWVMEEGRVFENADFLITPPADAWRRFSLRSTSARSLALVKALAAWREDTAQRTNVPRTWLLKDEVILDIALRKPTSLEALHRIRHFPSDDPVLEKDVVACIQTVLQRPDSELPQASHPAALSKSTHVLLDTVKLLLKITANQLELSPKLIAENDELVQWIRSPLKEPQDKGWRYDVFWKKAEALFHGDIKIQVQKGKVTVE
jgi:ribonuclease D